MITQEKVNSQETTLETINQFFSILGRSENIQLKALNAKHVPEEILIRNNQAYYDYRKGGKLSARSLVGTIDVSPTRIKFTELKVSKDEQGNYSKDEKGNLAWEPKYSTNAGFSKLQSENAKDYFRGMYFVVNEGGANDRDITSCPALFFEIDDKDFDEQWKTIHAVEAVFGKMSAIVKTAKSLHCYMVLDQPVSPEVWVTLQCRLIQLTKSDKSIRNPSRLMRIPGFYHISWNEETQSYKKVMCELVQVSDNKVGFNTVNTLLPLYDTEFWKDSEKKSKARKALDAEFFDPSAEFNLYNFAAKIVPHAHYREAEVIRGQCPIHTQNNPSKHSTDSLWIHSSGAFHAFCGCSTKEIYRHFIKVAQDEGLLNKPQDKVIIVNDEPVTPYQAAIIKEQEYLNRLDLTPTEVYTEGYLPKGTLTHRLTIVNSPMGTAKTTAEAAGKVEEFKVKHPTGRILMPSARNSLAKQTGEILGIAFHEDVPNPNLHKYVTGCWDSYLKYYGIEEDQPVLIILDEADANLQHLVTGSTMDTETHVKVLEQVSKDFALMNRENRYVVMMEDGVSNISYNLVSKMMGITEADVKYIQHTGKPIVNRTITLMESKNEVTDRILRGLQDGIKPIVPTDSKAFAEELDRILTELGYKGYSFHSDTSHESWYAEFSANPDKFITETQPDYLIYSPVFQSGNSISVKYFDVVAFVLTGSVEPRNAKQMLERYRSDAPWFGYINEINYNLETLGLNTARKVSQHIRDTRSQQCKVLEDTLIEQSNYFSEDGLDHASLVDKIQNTLRVEESSLRNYHVAYSQYVARENYGRANLKAELLSIWTAKGYKILEAESQECEETKEIVEAVKAQIQEEESQSYANADPYTMSKVEAIEVLKGSKTTPEQRLTAVKTIDVSNYPSLPLSSLEFVSEFWLKDKTRKRYEFTWKCKNPESAKVMEAWKILHSIKNVDKISLNRLPVESLQVVTIVESGVLELLTEELYSNASPNVLSIKDWALSNAKLLYNLFRIQIKDTQTPVEIVNKFLNKLGYRTSKTGKSENGERCYQISNLDCPYRMMFESALTEKFILDKRSKELNLLREQVYTAEVKEQLQGIGISDDEFMNLLTNDREVAMTQILESIENFDHDVQVVKVLGSLIQGFRSMIEKVLGLKPELTRVKELYSKVKALKESNLYNDLVLGFLVTV